MLYLQPTTKYHLCCSYYCVYYYWLPTLLTPCSTAPFSPFHLYPISAPTVVNLLIKPACLCYGLNLCTQHQKSPSVRIAPSLFPSLFSPHLFLHHLRPMNKPPNQRGEKEKKVETKGSARTVPYRPPVPTSIIGSSHFFLFFLSPSLSLAAFSII